MREKVARLEKAGRIGRVALDDFISKLEEVGAI